LQCVAVCCSVLQCVAACHVYPYEVCCSVLQCVAVCCSVSYISEYMTTYAIVGLNLFDMKHSSSACCNTLQHAATHCPTLQHTATHCNTPQPTGETRHNHRPSSSAHCNMLQHAATHCPTLQHTSADRRNVTQSSSGSIFPTVRHSSSAHCNMLQHAATHTATHCNTPQPTEGKRHNHCRAQSFRPSGTALPRAAAPLSATTYCCSVLQCVAVCCSDLQ